MTQRKLINAFLLAAPLALGGCASYTHVDTNTCSQWDERSLGIPEFLEIFKGKFTATTSTLCEEGYKIGYSALVGRNPDGNLNRASIIIWQKQYQALMDKISVTIPDEAKDLYQTKGFADYFVKDLSRGQITSEMLGAMYLKKTTNPKLFLPDGRDAPQNPTPTKEPVCVRTIGFFWECN